MDHPFIVKLHYAFQTKNKLYLLVDLMSGVTIILFRANYSTSYEGTKSSQSLWPSSMPRRYS